MSEKPRISPEELKRTISYNPETGGFVRIGSKRKLTRRSVKTKYLNIDIHGRRYRASNIAWCLSYGEWPDGIVDHINCDRTDDRLENLRLASLAENARNCVVRKDSRSGYKGVSPHKAAGKYQASIGYEGKNLYLGLHETAEKAAEAYDSKAIELFGEFAKTNAALAQQGKEGEK